MSEHIRTPLEDWKARNERKPETARKRMKGQPKTEKILLCQWPVKCFLETTSNVIDFGFNPPSIKTYCEDHAAKYRRLDRCSIVEPIHPKAKQEREPA